MKLIFNENKRCVGFSNDPLSDGVAAPDDFNADFLQCYFLERNKLKFDQSRYLDQLKAVQINRIKQQASDLISATDWKLQRARERDAAGWGSLADIDAVLVERETIRRSSDKAEAALLALSEASLITNFSWQVDEQLNPPQRLSRGEFLDRFSGTEIEQILAAAETNVALKRWILRLENSEWVKLSDAQHGLQALEIAGLLQPGRSQQILT